jgi:superfamily II DNA/RNA helicase
LDFSEFHFSNPLLEAVDAMGFREPTPVQKATIPPALEGKDIIACAQTGTGKTAAYLLPILQNMISRDQIGKGTACLVLVPTRELAVQIDQQFQGFAYFAGAVSVTVYGGGDSVGWDYQKKALTEGVDFVIAQDGSALSLLALDTLIFSHLNYLVLDEATRCTNSGLF